MPPNTEPVKEENNPHDTTSSMPEKENLRLSSLHEDDIHHPNEKPTSGPEIDDVEANGAVEFPDPDALSPPGKPKIIPSINFYQQKKTLAQGMMDIALLSANANQLRYILDAGYRNNSFFYVSLILVILSLIIQVVVGFLLILNSRCRIKDEHGMCRANRFNDWILLLIFLVTLINVFIPAFGVNVVDNGAQSGV